MNDVIHPTPQEPDAPRSSSRLGRADAVELAHYVSALARADLPMSAGTRAIASDLPPGQLAATLRSLAEALENGQSLEDAISPSLPPHVRELIVAGADSGQLADTLDTLLAHERTMDDLGQQLWQAISYPCTLFAFLIVWLLFIALWLVPQMDTSSVLADMEQLSGYGQYWNNLNEPSKSPYAARLAEFARVLPPMILTVGVCLIVAIIAVRLFGGRALDEPPDDLRPASWPGLAIPRTHGVQWFVVPVLAAIAAIGRRNAIGRHRGARRRRARRSRICRRPGRCRETTFRGTTPAIRHARHVDQSGRLGRKQQHAGRIARQRARMMAERFELQLRLIRLVVPPVVFVLAAGSALFVAYGWIGALSHAVRMLSSW